MIGAAASAATTSGSDSGIAPAIIGAVAAISVALISSIASYVLAVRQSRQDLKARLKQTGAEGEQARETAKRQYELEAIKRFRADVGPAKGQIIEAVHDLNDRLRSLFGNPQAPGWTSRHGYYQQTFIWLVLRPFTWRELLRRRTTYLDQSLSDLVLDEYAFLRDCHQIEKSLTDAAAFAGTGYDDTHSTAHAFAGNLREGAELLIVGSSGGEICMSASEFRDQLGSLREREPIAEIEPLLSNPDQVDRVTSYKLARLLILYQACSIFLNDWHLPYRHFESAQSVIELLAIVRDEDIRGAVQQYLAKGTQVEALAAPGHNRYR
ncbi:MAG TPA: hypothetical protein VHK65_09345 [Candidatus Dormibacteraeota bacterium]|nr:hypothetical protein [Candidatus Dormibacteraeota bacterium]